MKEVEIKILEIDKKEIIDKLKKAGAKKIFEGDVENIFYDFENKRLFSQGKKLRLRKLGDRFQLTFKGKKEKGVAKIRDEYEVYFDDDTPIKKILEELGLREINRYCVKHRISFVIEDVRFEIDDFKKIPAYLEIEGPSVKKIKKYVKKLGFSMDDIKSYSSRDVFNHYGKKEEMIKS